MDRYDIKIYKYEKEEPEIMRGPADYVTRFVIRDLEERARGKVSNKKRQEIQGMIRELHKLEKDVIPPIVITPYLLAQELNEIIKQLDGIKFSAEQLVILKGEN